MIELRDIRKSYDTLEVIKGVDLSVADGEILAIVGASGAGKSTLLHIMGTIDRPDCGTVLYNGTDVFRMAEKKLSAFRNGNIGFVFQFHQLLPEFTMLENVAMPALIAGTGRKEAFAHAQELIKYMGLTDRMSHKPAELSGGERQRAAVARALMNRPGVILADEPSGSLDSANRRELHKLFFDLRRDMGQTFVIVTHDDSLAADADRIVRMADGMISSITNGTGGE
jgi:lipoprotein-releasing system ATP-binding protein